VETCELKVTVRRGLGGLAEVGDDIDVGRSGELSVMDWEDDMVSGEG